MSSIANGIAGSVNQAALQQNQVAKAQNANKAANDEKAAKMRALLDQHIHEVEDAYHADAERERVDPDERRGQQERKKHVDEFDDDESAPPHIDVEA